MGENLVIPNVNLSSLRQLNRDQDRDLTDNRQRTLNRIAEYRAAEEKVKQVCQERGLEIPEIYC